MSLALAELDPLYGDVSHEEAVLIANLGAKCYSAAKEQLYGTWGASQNDAEREELWRKEGGTAMLESLKVRLAAGDEAMARVAALQSGAEAEIARRVEETVTLRMKEVELAKREEMLPLEKQLIELQSSTKYMTMLEESHSALKAQISQLQEENAAFKEAAATKSSHLLGKMGEATVFEMLSTYVAPMMSDAEVYDMTKIKHSGDFHVHVMGKHGKMVRVMVDVKKYKRAIDNLEIQKLYSDLDGCDVDVGLMLSLDSGICTKSQFQLARTKGNKLCMFLSFEKIDDGIRKEILSWAIRVLVGIVSTQDQSRQDTMVTEIQQFLVDMIRLVDKLDSGVKSLRGVYDVLRELKDDMITRISNYKTTCGLEVIDTIVETPVTNTNKAGVLCKALNRNGTGCKSRHVPGGIYCPRHESIEAKKSGTTVTLSAEGGDTIVYN